MTIQIPRRRVLGATALCLVLAAGALLIWRDGALPGADRQGGAGETPSAAANGGVTDRAYSSWPVEGAPPPEQQPDRTPQAERARATGGGQPSDPASDPFRSLSAGPAAAPGSSPAPLAAPAPAGGIGNNLSPAERERLMNDQNATEKGKKGTIRDRGGVRIMIPDDDQCVPRPPRPRF